MAVEGVSGLCGLLGDTGVGVGRHLSTLQYSQRTVGSVVKHQGAWSPSGFLHRFLLRPLLKEKTWMFMAVRDSNLQPAGITQHDEISEASKYTYLLAQLFNNSKFISSFGWKSRTAKSINILSDCSTDTQFNFWLCFTCFEGFHLTIINPFAFFIHFLF